ncbi:MAG TPA: hypothetical protein VLE02_05085 [Nitrosarchaeum sp.]|nr:hypothetical protein [Nitrosarchaeum sp.]
MTCICKHDCSPVKKPEGGYYQNGFKFCKVCDVFTKYLGIWCICCGNRLRSGPKDTKTRKKIEVCGY